MSQQNKSDRILDEAFKNAAASLPVEFDMSAWNDMASQLNQNPPLTNQNTTFNWLKNINLNSILITSAVVIVVSVLTVLNKTPSESTMTNKETVPTIILLEDTITQQYSDTINIVKKSLNNNDTSPINKNELRVVSLDSLPKKDSLIDKEVIPMDTLQSDSLENFLFWN